MKKTVLTSIFCIFAGLNFAAAEENVAPSEDVPAQQKQQAEKKDVCARFHNMRPSLKLRSSYGELTYNFDYDRENLDIMAARNRLTEEGMFTSGLSLVDVDWSVSLNTVSRSVGGTICVIPASVDIFLGYRNPVIYISNNIKEDSCQYKVVVRHEQQHQQVNVAVLDHYLPMLKNEFVKNLSVLKAKSAKDDADADALTDDMNAAYAEAIRPWVNRFQITLQLEQQRLDNRENYQYESKLCR